MKMLRDGATAPDRGGLWPLPFTVDERRVIRTQAKADRRNIPQIWLWPVISIEVEQGTDVHDTFWESARTVGGGRRYGEALAMHIYVDWMAERKARHWGVTMTKGTVKLGLSRAEARRVGLVLEQQAAEENRWSSPDEILIINGLEVPVRGELEFLFIPPPGSIFRWANRYYQVNQWEPKFYGATDIPVVWNGTGQQVSEDSTTPGMPQLVQPDTFRPPRPEGTPEGVRGRAGG